MGNLVIGRRLGESVYLSFGEIAVRVVIARAGAEVKLAIEAPLSVVITRGEFLGVGADAAMAARVVTDCNKGSAPNGIRTWFFMRTWFVGAVGCCAG